MACEISIPYRGTFQNSCTLEKAEGLLKQPEKWIGKSFPGLRLFEDKGNSIYHWEFEKFGYSSVELTIKLKTKIDSSKPCLLLIQPEKGAEHSLDARWELTPEKNGVKFDLSAAMILKLPIPGFMKAMAAPVAKKEITKLFDLYVKNVQKLL